MLFQFHSLVLSCSCFLQSAVVGAQLPVVSNGKIPLHRKKLSVLQPSVGKYLTVMIHIFWDLFSSHYLWPFQECSCSCKQNLTISVVLFTSCAPKCKVLSDTKTDVYNNKGVYHLELIVKKVLIILLGVELL